MNIAIFADIHGRILLAFKLCARWEHETGEKIDLILQAGDMGIYPAVEYLDKATIRHAEREPTELGFMHDFVEYRDATAAVLAQTTCNLVFVRGNHEAHAWLDNLEQLVPGPIFPVDAYQRLYCLKTGISYIYVQGNERLAVLGIGRIGQHSSQLKDTHIQPDEQARLKKLGAMPTDVLLTHDMPTGSARRSMGMPEITAALEKYRPSYHFYGHIGGEYQQGTSENGTTHYCKLADLDWRGTEHVVHPGSMAILRWHNQTTHTFSIVRAPWYQEYTVNTWLRL